MRRRQIRLSSTQCSEILYIRRREDDEKKRLSVCPWYTENWYDEDLEYALENAGIPLTDENIKN